MRGILKRGEWICTLKMWFLTPEETISCGLFSSTLTSGLSFPFWDRHHPKIGVNDSHHSRANTDSHTTHNTQHTRVKQNTLRFMLKYITKPRRNKNPQVRRTPTLVMRCARRPPSSFFYRTRPRLTTLVMRCARRPPSLTTPRRSIVRVVALAGPCRKFSALALALALALAHISACLHLLTISCDRFRVIVPTTLLSARASPTLKKSWVRIPWLPHEPPCLCAFRYASDEALAHNRRNKDVSRINYT
jgi:hypothetical protein